jgi:uncharacterized protein
MAVPIAQYVLKVHTRCNLACDHCYVYEHADQSWREKPLAMSAEVAGAAAQRIAEHAAARGIPEVFIVLHGGEPLLIGPARMRELLELLTTRVGAVARLDLRVHTNGVLLDRGWCDLLREYGVKVGVSLDGDAVANDLHRRYADGRSSHHQVLAALRLLRRLEYRHLYAGILCTIDLANDPVAVYEALAAEAPPNLDLLLPHATWEHPPPRPGGVPAPYADWLLRIYRRWEADGRPVPIRIFDSLLSAARGGRSFTESLGTDPGDLLVVEANGDWEQPDSMKTAYDGAAATGMNVFRQAVDEVIAHPAIAARQLGLAGLSQTCRACAVVDVCGGGLYAHRYRPPAGEPAGPDAFRHPSVYCGDLKSLIGGVLSAQPQPLGVTPERAARPPASALPAAALEGLAAGPGDPAGIAVLANVRLAQARKLVAAIGGSEVGWHDADLRSAWRDGWLLLSRLSRTHPDAVNDVLAHPYTYTWAVRCLRPRAGSDADLDRAHLAGLALAAAHRAGVAAALPSPVRDGYAHLPTAGAIAVAPGNARSCVVTVAPGHAPSSPGGRWQAVRSVRGESFGSLTLEDLDPFRDCQKWPVTGRLPPDQWHAWNTELSAALRHLAATVPAYARGLATGLRAVTPLLPAAGTGRSDTARQAFGAVGIALPGAGAPPGQLAELLLHEFQHVKLYVLMDLVPMVEPAADLKLRVPWREDPRPLEGVLHGCYAFLAVAHLRRGEGKDSRAAYLRYRSWVAAALDDILEVGDALTPDGRRFAAGMAAVL